MYLQPSKMSIELKGLQLENFKSFKHSNELKFKKLTILTGANSSGKSSIIQAIVGALQSNAFPFLFSTNGKFINMGDFIDISHKHEKAAEIAINFRLLEVEEKQELYVKTGWKINRSNKLCQLNTFEAHESFFHLKLERKGQTYNLSYDYYPEKDPEADVKSQTTFQSIVSAIISTRGSEKKKKKKKEKSPDEITKEHFAEVHIKDIPLKIGANGLALIKDQKIGLRFRYLIDVFNEISSNANLISSFRLHPNRTHLESSQDSNKVKKFGEGYLDQIIRWETGNSKKKSELITHLKQLSLLHSIETDRIRGGRYDMLVTTTPNGTKVSLSDVGFGVSQFLPILVADLQLSKNSTLIVAQPEIHLHPNVAAGFANYLVGQIDKNQKNYIIETHSECFLNRIRLAIVKGELKEEDLSVYYLENTKGETKIYELIFNKKGQIENAPSGFFDTYLMDLRDIAVNADL